MKCIGILSLLLGHLLFLSHPAKAGQPAISEIMGSVVVEVLNVTAQIYLGRLLNPSNDNLSDQPNNKWVGFQMQGPCTSAGSEVPGGAGLPCVPNFENPNFGAGLQVVDGLDKVGCYAKSMNGAQTILGTFVPIDQAVARSGVQFGPREELHDLSPGGVCDKPGPNAFVGNLAGKVQFYHPNGLSDNHCAFLVNMCLQHTVCSCGHYYYDGH